MIDAVDRREIPSRACAMSEAPAPRNPLKKLRTKLRELHQRHTARHRPTGFGFVFADRIDYVDGARWDTLAAQGGFFLRRNVLRVIEAHGPGNIQPRYAMVFAARSWCARGGAGCHVTGDRIGGGSRSATESATRGLLRKVVFAAAKSPSATIASACSSPAIC